MTLVRTMNGCLRWVAASLVLWCTSGLCLAADEASLAAESEAYCTSTVRDRPTPPDMIVAKVKEACELLEKEGPAAFPKFKGRSSPFIYEGTYIWVHRLADAEMLMHPIKVKMVGNKLVSLKDANGKRFFVVMNDLVSKQGEGWVDYHWPKPGTSEAVQKVSYVRRCRMADGVEVVVGSGIYKTSEQDLARLTLN